MLITLSVDTEHDESPLLLHVREHRAPGLFSRLTGDYEHVWERASQTLATEHDLDNYLHDHDPDVGPPDDAQGTAALDQPVKPATETAPRHWPRRPQ
jgi:hypothetical protein